MDMDLSIGVAFVLGIGSSIHCVGMCGGIVSALSLGLPEKTRKSTLSHFMLVCSYNAGRIISYTIAGLVVGTIGYVSPLSSSGGRMYVVLQFLAFLFLAALGLHIAGYLPQLKKIETIGLRVWNLIRPLGKHVIPADTVARAIVAGSIWGWLPCGLVYAVLVWTLASVHPWEGALYMFVFGLGTLPSMVTTGLASNAFARAAGGSLRRLCGLVIITLGLLAFVMNIGMGEHSAHIPSPAVDHGGH